MSKKLFLLITFSFLISGFLCGQQLSLDETIDYINSYLPSGTTISLTSEGIFEFSGQSDFDNIRSCKVHISEITAFVITSSSPFSNTKWGLQIKCGSGRDFENSEPCIQDVTKVPTTNIEMFSIYPKDNSKYSAQKLENAFQFFFAAVKENGNYERTDTDPFAPHNYNKHAIEIKGTSNNTNIKLENEGGVYYVWVTIGNIRKRFILDTGASDVLVSKKMENELIKVGLIKKSNYLTSALYRIADGSIVECRRFLLPSLKIGNFTIQNVTASIGIGDTPLLLGKSFLDRFSTWSINNSSQTLKLTK